jgi:NTP pyrophosphatase (non-canonical NTP hydrolase)
MNLTDLQARLRRFAAERRWEPYQTPKNLAMAMTVEAAELLEIFQWMTAEESVAIAADPARHQHLGEELADVLLYLVQIADHGGVDLEAAVERKLKLNAAKYPPLAAG